MAKKRLYRCFHYFTRGELALWGTSTALILAFFLAYDRTQFGILAGVSDRSDLPDLQRQGKPLQTAADGVLQRAVRYHFFLLRVLWRDGDLPGDDRANGGVRPGLLAAESL